VLVSGELRDQLQASLGNAYVIERELGGGGMSRVFVATEAALGAASSSRCCRRIPRRR
jgi:serine/threonine-protein kinase